jgi:hypothetical protein
VVTFPVFYHELSQQAGFHERACFFGAASRRDGNIVLDDLPRSAAKFAIVSPATATTPQAPSYNHVAVFRCRGVAPHVTIPTLSRLSCLTGPAAMAEMS